MDDLENFATGASWAALERYLGLAIRGLLADSVQRLKREIESLRLDLRAARTGDELERMRVRIVRFRGLFLRTETMLDFFGDAVNTRTNPRIAALLAACDKIAVRSMRQVLDQLAIDTPPALTYVDRGLGASILRAGLRLWDPSSLNPVAAVKIVRHNLLRPTALVHETGHQVAHLTGWNEEVAATLQRAVPGESGVGDTWASWASEVAADVFAFVHTGYASVATLHDVLAGDDEAVFRFLPGDPHPVAYVRVLFGAQLCRVSYGKGPWDDLARSWIRTHPVDQAPREVARLLVESVRAAPQLANACLSTPMGAFGGRSVSSLVDPGRVSPPALETLATQARVVGGSTSWLERECVRLLSLSGHRAATSPERAVQIAEEQEDWMLMLGRGVRAAVA
jgi:hypothetical protein